MLTYLLYGALAYAVYKIVQGAKDGDKAAPPKKKKMAGVRPPHEVLGIDKNATEQEIRRAYQAKMRDYHPDKVANAGDELRNLAEKRSKEINAAYEAMMKPFVS